MDYLTLLQLKLPLKRFYLFLVFFVSLFLSIFLNLEIYDTQSYKGICTNGLIYLEVPTDYLDTLINGDFLKIKGQKYSFKIVNLETPELGQNSYLYYQRVALMVDKQFYNNEVIDLTAYANKEKIKTKLRKIF